jgi:hypothetical protein
MAELDKKMQKNPPDLVQSVLEAMEKRSVERVDMLITNAFKQLKMSRFKPDQTTYMSLTYLARICPKAFSQSTALKELLKTHIKRDSGPTNIKGTKNDFVLPVLSANILLACCDSADVRSIILTRIEQWIGSNQKLNELVQHLLAVLCVRCNDDPQTIKTLIEIRSHWYQYLDSNYDTYGPVAQDLSRAIRNLLFDENISESLTENLYFLTKHDSDIVGLSRTISKLIISRPITIGYMLDQPELGEQLIQMLISIYDKLFDQLDPAVKKEELEAPIFIRVSHQNIDSVVALDRCVIEALLITISSHTMLAKLEIEGPFVSWLRDQRSSPYALAYDDITLTKPIELPTRLLQRLLQSDELQADLAIKCAHPFQLFEFVQSLGLEVETLKKIFEKLKDINTDDFIKSGIKDLPFFIELVELYEEMGIEEARRLIEIDTSSQDFKDVEQKPEVLVKIKSEPV